MTFRALHRRVTFVFAALGFLALALGAELGPAWSTLLGAGFVASWFAEGPAIHTPRYTRMLTAAALASFVLLGVYGYLSGTLLDSVVGYAGLLQLTRLAQRRTATEHLHVVGLGLLHLLAGTLLSTGLDYALVFLGFVVVSPWMLTLTHLRAEIEKHHATTEELAGPPTEHLQRMLDSRNLASRGFLLGSSLLSLPLFLVTAAFFLLFPRVGLGMFTFGERSGAQVAGFGNTVDLGGFGTIRDDPTVIARVFSAELGVEPPPTLSIRLRGTSFDRYDGRRWTRTPSPGVRREGRFGPIELFDTPRRPRQRASIRLIVEPLDESVLFLPERTSALDVRPRIESGFDVPRPVLVRPGIDIRLAETEGIDLDYTALVDAESEGWPEPLDAEMERRLLELPPGLERVAALAREVAGGATDPATIASRLLAHLRDSGRYRYTIDLPDPGDADPLVYFLFESRAGHCELFATAMAVMLRANGVPARNVTGLLGGRYNRFGRYYALSQGDAHSWVEASIDGRFATFDPTPPARESFTPPVTAFSNVRAWLDALRTRWSRDVIGYDMRRQVELLFALRDRIRAMRGTSSGGHFEADVPERPDAAMASRSRDALAGFVCALSAIGVLAGLVAMLRRRRRGPALDPAEQAYRAMERALHVRGLGRPEDRTPLEHVRFVEAAGYEAAAAVRLLTELHEAARYGGRDFGPHEQDLAAQAMRAIARTEVQRMHQKPR